MQGVNNLFEVDTVRNIMLAICEKAGVPVQVKSSGGKKVTYACVSGVPLYYSDGMLILENGMVYSIGDTSPDYSALLSTITG